MRLKKLELVGFKSFADRTEIHFDDGVTCIVGPNGCGKSNISDSIRWVLGERSAKMLRGSRMEDVIFSGTDFRKPVSLAEVSLTIDNSDRGLPIDYQEVTITRRLYRSGESEYLINKTLCRLKDIQDLILDTGIGSSSYSMIEQGRIDYILNANADERRFLIEEAAGISKFKVKKEEAIRKLEKTEENLLRLKDILAEVTRNIQYAEKQAKRAEKYKEQFEKLKNLETTKAFYDVEKLDASRNEIEQNRGALTSNSDALSQKIQEQQDLINLLSIEFKQIVRILSEEEGKRYSLLSSIEQVRQSHAFNQEKKLEIATRRGQIHQEKLTVNDQIAQNQSQISDREQELLSIEQEKNSMKAAWEESDQKLIATETEIASCKQSLDLIKSDYFEALSQVTHLRNTYHRTVAFLETADAQHRKKEAGLERFQKEIDEWKDRNLSYDEQIRAAKGKLTAAEQEKRNLTGRHQDLAKKTQDVEEELRSVERLAHEKLTRKQLLEDIDKNTPTHLETLFDPAEGIRKELYQTLKEIFVIKSGYEQSLEAILGCYTHSLIAEDFEACRALLPQIQGKKPGQLGLFIRTGLANDGEQLFAPPVCDKPLRPFTDVLSIKEGYAHVFAPLFKKIFILESFDLMQDLEFILPQASHFQFVTPDGWIIGPKQQILYTGQKASSEANLFARTRELSQLNSEIAGLSERRNSLETGLAAHHNHVALNEQLLEEAETAILQSAIHCESLGSFQKGVDDRLNSYTKEVQLLLFEKEELANQHQETYQQKLKLEENLNRAEDAENRIRSHQETLLAEIQNWEDQKAVHLADVADKKMRYEGSFERTQLLQNTIQLLTSRKDQDRQRLITLDEETVLLSDRYERIQKEDEELVQTQLGLENSIRSIEVQLQLTGQKKEAMETALTATQADMQTLAAERQQLQEQFHKLEMKLMDIGFQIKTILERMEQTFRIHLNELDRNAYAIAGTDPDSLNEQIQILRGRVENLGTVNLLAIEEYDELKQRFDFLNGQQKDLEDARESLLEAIRKINRTTKGLFEETFAKVQQQFQEYYQVLFRGGEARLVLIDESNPLESGIDIVVRPPGKKLQHITLLSGGEKALTAIALLFALFRIKPSPFCVLDEVDAPLDEANIDRFLTVLRTFLDSSQFIIVTHNRKSIAMGDALYGVTMEEAGISKIVSVKVNLEASLNGSIGTKTTEPISAANNGS